MSFTFQPAVFLIKQMVRSSFITIINAHSVFLTNTSTMVLA